MMQQLLDNNTISKEQIDSVLTNGKVNFSKSEVDRTQDLSQEKCSTYFIDGKVNNEPIELVVKNCRFQAEIIRINKK